MPLCKDREYRQFSAPLLANTGQNKRLESSHYVEGYATTFDTPYLLYEYDGIKFFEVIDRNALMGADISDVIMQYNHSGRVLARLTNKTLGLEATEKGLFIFADLSKSDIAQQIYNDIAAELLTKMSWAFTIAEESYNNETRTRTITKIRKVYDVSAVSIPANGDTEISARSYAQGRIEAERLEELNRRARLLMLKIKTA